MAFGLYGKALGEDELQENGWISYNKENVKAYDENPLMDSYLVIMDF